MTTNIKPLDVEKLSNNDKQRWVKIGAEAEDDFLARAFAAGLAVMKNPIKKANVFEHDMFVTVPADLKTVKTRFYEVGKLYGLDPRSAVTINEKDLTRYEEKYPHILIIFNIDYGDFKRVCCGTLDTFARLAEQGQLFRHEYMDRVLDREGNAKASYVFDSMLLREL